jgi:hypothetical protein
MTKVKILVDDLTENEVWALAQMCKLMTWDEFRRLSADRAEREVMDLAVIKLRKALAEVGTDPR